MDITARQITKIAREVSKFTVRTLKQDGIGTAEMDFIHVVRKNPGITQAQIREILGIDKGACARRAANLEQKGYLKRVPDSQDKRAQKLYACEIADQLKQSKAEIEALYYAWLMEELTTEEAQQFTQLLNRLYLRNKAESRAGFPQLTARLEKAGKESL